jgi:hypothetical protein
MIRRILKVKFAIVRMPGAAIRIVGVDIQDDKLYDVLVQNIGDSDLKGAGLESSWAVCIKRGDGSIVSPSVTGVTRNTTLTRNSIMRIYVNPTRLYLQSGSVKITVNGPEGTSASYTIEP